MQFPHEDALRSHGVARLREIAGDLHRVELMVQAQADRRRHQSFVRRAGEIH